MWTRASELLAHLRKGSFSVCAELCPSALSKMQGRRLHCPLCPWCSVKKSSSAVMQHLERHHDVSHKLCQRNQTAQGRHYSVRERLETRSASARVSASVFRIVQTYRTSSASSDWIVGRPETPAPLEGTRPTDVSVNIDVAKQPVRHLDSTRYDRDQLQNGTRMWKALDLLQSDFQLCGNSLGYLLL